MIPITRDEFAVVTRTILEYNQWQSLLTQNEIETAYILENYNLYLPYRRPREGDDQEVLGFLNTEAPDTLFCRVSSNSVRKAMLCSYRTNPITEQKELAFPLTVSKISNNIYTTCPGKAYEYFQSEIDINLFEADIVERHSNDQDITINNKELTLDLIDPVHSKRAFYARNRRYMELIDCSLPIDTIAPFSLLGDMPNVKQAFLSTTNNNRIPAIKISNLYRGGSTGDAVAELVPNARPQKIAKGGHIFMYKMSVLAIDFETTSWKPVTIYNLGIFEPRTKVIKYKRSRTFIPKIATELFDNEGLKYFAPEEWEEYILKQYGHHTTYWNGITRIFPKGLPPKTKVINNILDQHETSPEELNI